MKVIHKHPLPIQERTVVELPFGAKVLTIQVQNGKVFLWAEIDTIDTVMVDRVFFVFETGYPLPSNPMSYITTIQLNGLVYHIYKPL